jgi:hypothetical protein
MSRLCFSPESLETRQLAPGRRLCQWTGLGELQCEVRSIVSESWL